MNQYRVEVAAKGHRYTRCPVSTCLEESGIDVKEDWVVTDTSSGSTYPVQFGIEKDNNGSEGQTRVRVHWVLEDLAPGEKRTFLLHKGNVAVEGSRLEQKQDRVEVFLDNQLFTAYYYGPQYPRPFMYPLMGPYEQIITRSYPMQEIAGETRDHKHHRSFWVAWGDVNGSDNWSEEEGHATIAHRDFLCLESGPVYAGLTAANDWLDSDGKKVMEETRRVLIYSIPGPAGRILDMSVVWRASDGPVRFGDTKEGGVASIRVATKLDVSGGTGRIENSFGGVNEDETWGKRACWCDYSGMIDNKAQGIAIFDHPGNFRHPTYWHVRNYGLMTANPFGLSYFLSPQDVDGSYTLPGGESMLWNYRIYIHPGDATTGCVAEKYNNYITPPEVRVTG